MPCAALCYLGQHALYSSTRANGLLIPIHWLYTITKGHMQNQVWQLWGLCCFRNWMFLSSRLRKERCVPVYFIGLTRKRFISITGRLPSCVYTHTQHFSHVRSLLFTYFETPRTWGITRKIRLSLFITTYFRDIFQFHTCIQLVMPEMCAKTHSRLCKMPAAGLECMFSHKIPHIFVRFQRKFECLYRYQTSRFVNFHENLSDSRVISRGHI